MIRPRLTDYIIMPPMTHDPNAVLLGPVQSFDVSSRINVNGTRSRLAHLVSVSSWKLTTHGRSDNRARRDSSPYEYVSE